MTLTLESALRELFGVQLYKNNACALLSRFLSILNLDWLQHALRGVYDNNYCVPFFLRSLCKIRGDCFGLRLFWAEVFFLGSTAPKEKYLGIKTITDNFTQWPKQRWCIIISVTILQAFQDYFLYKNVIKTHFSSTCVLIPLWSFWSIQTYVHCAAWQTDFKIKSHIIKWLIFTHRPRY